MDHSRLLERANADILMLRNISRGLMQENTHLRSYLTQTETQVDTQTRAELDAAHKEIELIKAEKETAIAQVREEKEVEMAQVREEKETAINQTKLHIVATMERTRFLSEVQQYLHEIAKTNMESQIKELKEDIRGLILGYGMCDVIRSVLLEIRTSGLGQVKTDDLRKLMRVGGQVIMNWDLEHQVLDLSSHLPADDPDAEVINRLRQELKDQLKAVIDQDNMQL